jgi:DNA polymerase I-like protein with 3'-5' exonuclease and polymerase domains|tara:strand:+ start:4664 stop:7009 length:2346 start_codon:yes stop_codon:yes gene_type:complete
MVNQQVIEKKYYKVDSKETLQLLFQHIQESPILAYDTETTSLNPRKGKIIGFSVSGDEGIGFYLPTMAWNNTTETLEECTIEGTTCHSIAKKLIAMLVGKKLIMHNASFDTRYTHNFYGVDLLPSLWVDTALLVHTVKEEGAFGYGSPFGLKPIAIMIQDEIGLDVKEAANQEQVELKASIKENGGVTTRVNFEIYKADIDILSKYAAADTDLTLRICNHFLKVLKEEDLEKFFFEDEVMPLYREVTIPMEVEGIALNIPLIEETREDIMKDQARYKSSVMTELLKLSAVKEWVMDSALKAFPPSPKGKWASTLVELYGLPMPKTARGYSLKQSNVLALEEHPVREYLLSGELDHLEEETVLRVSMKLWKESNDGVLINIQSKKQLAEITFDYLKEKPLSKTAKGQAQFDDDAIQALSGKYEWLKNLRLYNKLLKIKSTYIDRFYNAAEDGRFYPYFKQNGTVSGRYGSDLQQLPKPKEEGEADPIIVKYTNTVRAFFIADTGTVFIDSDYTSLEPHLFASVSDDKALQEIFNKEHDFYSTVAIRTEKLNDDTAKYPDGVSADTKAPNFLKKLDPVKRNTAKGYSLGIAYGMSAYALAMSLGVSKVEGKRLHQGYLDGFPGVAKWIDDSREKFKRDGFIRNEVGRIRHLDKGKAVYDIFGESIMDWKMRKDLERDYGKDQVLQWYRDYKNALNNCLNYQLQSLAASVVNRAALVINRKFKELGINGVVVAQIHDQLVMRCPAEDAPKCVGWIQDLMENTTKMQGVTLKAPPEIATNLADGH